MSQELLYTSAPKGLKSGAHGFCMVLCSEGMPAPLATALEGLSAYKPVYPVGDPAEDQNPVTAMHVLLPAIGRKLHVLSRVASYGLDYSGRPNKLAHHVVLDAGDMAPAGPAWMLLQSSVMKKEWSGEPKVVPANRRLATGDAAPGPCRAWARATGDPGWAGVLAESLMKDPTRLAYLIIEPNLDVLPLFAEAIALLPPDRRWQATFSTYFTTLPAGATCNWRCLLADSPLVHQSKRHVQALRLDLTGHLGKAPDGEWTEYARTGRRPRVADAARPVAPAAAPLPADFDFDEEAYELAGPGQRGLMGRRPPRRRRDRKASSRNLVLTVGGLALITAIAAGLILWAGRKPARRENSNPEVAVLDSQPTADSSSTVDSPSTAASPSPSEPPSPQLPLNSPSSADARESTSEVRPEEDSTQTKNEPQPASPTPPPAESQPVAPPIPVPVAPPPRRIIQWASLATSSTTVTVPSPLLPEEVTRVRFLMPKSLPIAPVRYANVGDSPLLVNVSTQGRTLDTSELTHWFSIELGPGQRLAITVDNDNRLMELDSCAIHLAAKNDDQFTIPLTSRRVDPHPNHRRDPHRFDAGPSRTLTVPLTIADKTPMPALAPSGFSMRIGQSEIQFDQIAKRQKTPKELQGQLRPGNQYSVTLYPSNLAPVFSAQFTDDLLQNSAIEHVPQLTLSIPDNSNKVDVRSLSIEWKIPKDPGGFLEAVRRQLRQDLIVLSLNEAPTVAPNSGMKKEDRQFALPSPPPVLLKRIEVPLSLDIPTLESMRDHLKRWSAHTADRKKELSHHSDVTTDVFRSYVAEVDSLQSTLEKYAELLDAAMQVRNDLEKVTLVEGRVTYPAVDVNDHNFEVNIPVFEVSQPEAVAK